ncbi:hypothetical protein LY78DRAFT_253996 [Colletotrichum sublineola]|nr:hypothetical protein LY78DRAFT_253996 [Colletotrichum sublineola]
MTLLLEIRLITDTEAICNNAYKLSWSTAFVRDENFNLATETCFNHPFLGHFLCSVVLTPCQIIKTLPASVHRLHRLNRARFLLGLALNVYTRLISHPAIRGSTRPVIINNSKVEGESPPPSIDRRRRQYRKTDIGSPVTYRDGGGDRMQDPR